MSMVLGAVGCRQAVVPEIHWTGSIARFIAEPPYELFNEDLLYRPVLVETWPVQTGGINANGGGWIWGPEEPDSGNLAPGGSRGLERATLRRAVDLEARRVQTVEVVLARSSVEGEARTVHFSWRRSDELTFPPGRRRPVRLLMTPGAEPGVHQLNLVMDSDWRGEIAEIAIHVQPGAASGQLQEVRVLSRVLNRTKAQRVNSRGILTDIHQDVRESLVALPGSSIARRLDIEEGDQLEFSVGVRGRTFRPLEFQVVVEERGLETVVWRTTVSVDQNEEGRWSEETVDLGGHAGAGRVLRLEVVGDSKGGAGAPEGGLAEGLPFWGSPEVRRIREESRRGPNLVLISLDTVRADHLSAYGYPKPTSPVLAAWADDHGVVFEEAIAGAPWTLPSHMSLLSGLDALHHGFNHDVGRVQDSPRNFELLAETLRRSGYVSAAATGGAYLHPRYGFDHGFSSYRYWKDRARDDSELQEGVNRTLDFVATERSQPFFFFLHTYAAHDPYEAYEPYFSRVASPGVVAVPGEIHLTSPPNRAELGFGQEVSFRLSSGGIQRSLGPNDRPLIEAFYDSGLARIDAELGRLFKGLEELDLLDSTMIVITSDHGEALLEEGRAGHVDLFDSVLRVPLVIAWPGGEGAGRRVKDQVRSVDILPTILQTLEIDLPTTLDGVSLVELAQDGKSSGHPSEAWSYSAAANRGLSLRRQGLKLIVNNDAWLPRELDSRQIVAWSRQLYDLGADPGESNDRWTDGMGPIEGRPLMSQLEKYWDESGLGLRLAFHNPGSGVFRGQIKGAMIRPVGTKSIDLSCRCLEWEEMGRASFSLPPGESFVLQFEKVFGKRLSVDGEFEESGKASRSFTHTFDADWIGQGEILSLLPSGRWKRTRDTSEDGEGVRLVLRPGIGWVEAEASPADSDPELREDLKALGYL
ncbi:MAG: sulfatase [Thermoanaerobaculia bacterium]|nr:sulfatase [Thermoanaerobaculia bacterium]